MYHIMYLYKCLFDSFYRPTMSPDEGGVLALDLLSFGAGVALELLAAPFEDATNVGPVMACGLATGKPKSLYLMY